MNNSGFRSISTSVTHIGQIRQIHSKANSLLDEHGERIREIVSEGCRTVKGGELLRRVMNDLDLPQVQYSGARVAVYSLLQELLTPEERRKKLSDMRKKNGANVDFSALAKQGGLENIRRHGPPGGEILWTEEELKTLHSLAQNPDNRYTSGAAKGKLCAERIREQFISAHPNSIRSLGSIRAVLKNREKSRRLWEKFGMKLPQ